MLNKNKKSKIKQKFFVDENHENDDEFDVIMTKINDRFFIRRKFSTRKLTNFVFESKMFEINFANFVISIIKNFSSVSKTIFVFNLNAQFENFISEEKTFRKKKNAV